jgi:serine/threonine-protein kinase RsbW
MGLSPNILPELEGLRLSLTKAGPTALPAVCFHEAIRLSDQELALFALSMEKCDVPLPYLTALCRMALQHHAQPEKPAHKILSEILGSLSSEIGKLQIADTMLFILDRRTNDARFCGQRHIVGFQIEPDGSYREIRNNHPPDSRTGAYTDTQLSVRPNCRLLLPFYDPHDADAQALNDLPGFLLEVTAPPLKAEVLRQCGLPEGEPVRINIIRDFDKMRELIKNLMEETDKLGYPLRFQKNFRLVLLELLTNAIIHGNSKSPDKKVVTISQITPAQILVGVIDEGNGYDDKSLPDPLLPENMSKPHGRGIYIVKHYSSEFQLRGCGNCTVIRMKREKD